MARSVLHRLKDQWRRTSSRLALFVGMGLCLAGPVRAQQVETALPGTAATETKAAILYPTLPIAEDSDLYVEFSKTQLGRDMLAFAKTNGVKLSYDPNLKASFGIYNVSNGLSLQCGMTMADQLITLAHELRHVWQDHYFDYNSIRETLVSAQDRWTLSRLIETDAFAFSAYFMADRMQGAPILDAPHSEKECNVAFLLAAEMKTPDKLTLAEYRRIAFEKFIGASADFYTFTHLRLNTIVTNSISDMLGGTEYNICNGDLKTARAQFNQASALIDKAPIRSEFEKIMRRYGSFSLDPQARSCLQDGSVSTAQLMEEYAFRTEGDDGAPDPQFVAGLRNAFHDTDMSAAEIRMRAKDIEAKLIEAETTAAHVKKLPAPVKTVVKTSPGKTIQPKSNPQKKPQYKRKNPHRKRA